MPLLSKVRSSLVVSKKDESDVLLRRQVEVELEAYFYSVIWSRCSMTCAMYMLYT